jgi:hypothetical protein
LFVFRYADPAAQAEFEREGCRESPAYGHESFGILSADGTVLGASPAPTQQKLKIPREIPTRAALDSIGVDSRVEGTTGSLDLSTFVVEAKEPVDFARSEIGEENPQIRYASERVGIEGVIAIESVIAAAEGEGSEVGIAKKNLNGRTIGAGVDVPISRAGVLALGAEAAMEVSTYTRRMGQGKCADGQHLARLCLEFADAEGRSRTP